MNHPFLAYKIFLIAILIGSCVSNVNSQQKKGIVTQASFSAKVLSVENKVEVEVDYKLKNDSSNQVKIKGLLFDNKQITFSSVLLNEQNVSADFSRNDDLLSMPLRIPDSLFQKEVNIKLHYEVFYQPHENLLDITLAVIYIDWPSDRSANDPFEASVTLPRSFDLIETFPSTNWEMLSESRYHTEVPAIPSMLRIKAVGQKTGGFSFSYIIDISVAMVLMVLLVLAWRKLKMTT